jgi:phosphopantothenoylcysteine decarboxylase / phosphopantothenate---cysteine ligase
LEFDVRFFQMNVLFILTGSIACYKACDAISQLVQRGHTVRTVATEAALRFVGVATLEGLTRSKVSTDLFAPGEALDHITLTRWADLTVVCPATAHTLNRMAAGLGDDLAGALLLAHDRAKPLLVAPAMNPTMWTHPATTASVDRLRSWGIQFVQPGEGRTACGEVGEGRLAEPDEIVAAIEAALHRPSRKLRVLVTSGGTSEPIDGVRVLTNTSTGATGALIADHFRRMGHDVLLIRAANAEAASLGGPEQVFTSFADLDSILASRLAAETFDVVIHAAAISDFAVEGIEVNGIVQRVGTGKIPSTAAPIIRLRRNPKLLDSLRTRSRNPKLQVVAFKLTRDADTAGARTAVESILNTGAADFVVHNDLSQRGANGAFPAEIWRRGEIAERCSDRQSLASALERLLTAQP